MTGVQTCALPILLHRWKEDGELMDQPQRRRIGLPVVNKLHKTLTFHAWYPGCPMEEDAYGIPKPKDTPTFEPTILLVPCVGYGPRGLRLGYGGGYNDRTIAALRAHKPLLCVGIAYAVQEFDTVPHDRLDQRLDWLVTEKGARRIERRRFP